MLASEGAAGTSHRPEFMAVLGLLPPYALEDVRAAYRQKVLAAHPDRGGEPAEFVRLSEAYDRALEYVTFRGDRRAWIAEQVESHLAQEEVAAAVRQRGGSVEIESMEWVKESWGEGFEQLATRLRCIRLRGQADGDAFLAYLKGKRLPYLAGLDLGDCRVTDAGLESLAGREVLQWLDLSRTAITYHGLLRLLRQLPSLAWLNVRGTRVGWLRRLMLQRSYPRTRIVVGATGMTDWTLRGPIMVPLGER
jgi:hypothetical protein